MECEICNGAGWFQQPNYQHEVMEWTQCLDCLAEEKYQQDLLSRTAKLISKTSQEKMSKMLAVFCVKKIDSSRLETMLKEKNYISIMSFLEVNLK